MTPQRIIALCWFALFVFGGYRIYYGLTQPAQAPAVAKSTPAPPKASSVAQSPAFYLAPEGASYQFIPFLRDAQGRPQSFPVGIPPRGIITGVFWLKGTITNQLRSQCFPDQITGSYWSSGYVAYGSGSQEIFLTLDLEGGYLTIAGHLDFGEEHGSPIPAQLLPITGGTGAYLNRKGTALMEIVNPLCSPQGQSYRVTLNLN